MSVRLQRAVSILMIIAVLAMSVDCSCAAVIVASSPVATPPMSCCSHHAGMGSSPCPHQTNHHDLKPCESHCQHCGQSVINDLAGLNDLPISAPCCAMFLAPAIYHVAAGLDVNSLDAVDSPPPACSSTLLGLHCALTI